MTYSIPLCSVTQLASDDPDQKVQRCYMSVLWDGLRSVLPASEIGTGPSMRTDPNRREKPDYHLHIVSDRSHLLYMGKRDPKKCRQSFAEMSSLRPEKRGFGHYENITSCTRLLGYQRILAIRTLLAFLHPITLSVLSPSRPFML